MDEKKINGPDEAPEGIMHASVKEVSAEERREALSRQLAEERARMKDALAAMSEGKGRLRLDSPIPCDSGDGESLIEELPYDFTALTGLEYTEAMDSDVNASSQQIFRITQRQALALFAKAAAKETARLDMQDILARIGAADTVAAVQLATLFFGASTRAGQKRISKR